MMDGIYLRMLFVKKIRTKYFSQYLKRNEFSSLKYFFQSEFSFDLEPSQANEIKLVSHQMIAPGLPLDK